MRTGLFVGLAAVFVSACGESNPPASRATVVEHGPAEPPPEPVPSLAPPPRIPMVAPPPGLERSPLGDTARAFAIYLNGMHNQIHPLFADGYLASLGPPANDASASATLEIVIGRTGAVDHVRVTRTSGRTEFDVAAVDSVVRAGPYPTPPPETLSADGKLYVGWELKRDPVFACSTMLAQPYLFR